MLAAEAKASKLVRGIRMQLHWHENPLYRFAPRPDLMNEPLFRRESGEAAGLRLAVRTAGLHQPDEGRGAAHQGFPRNQLRVAPCRHAGGSFRRGPCCLARRDAAPRADAEPLCKTFGARHFHSPRGSGAYRRHRPADHRDVRRRGAASSAPTSRSRSCGRATRSWSTPIAARWPRCPKPTRRVSFRAQRAVSTVSHKRGFVTDSRALAQNPQAACRGGNSYAPYGMLAVGRERGSLRARSHQRGVSAWTPGKRTSGSRM